jgi:hypothetical protein
MGLTLELHRLPRFCSTKGPETEGRRVDVRNRQAEAKQQGVLRVSKVSNMLVAAAAASWQWQS